MEPILTTIMTILGKYAIDKGADLGKQVGSKALEKAKEIFTAALDRLRRDPAGEMVAQEFQKSPEVYQKPLEQKLSEALEADPDFAAQLRDILEQYEKAAKEHASATETSYDATISGTGSAAQGNGATAATATGGGIAIGSVGGDVNVAAKDKEK
jgi:hypothetical protein